MSYLKSALNLSAVTILLFGGCLATAQEKEPEAKKPAAEKPADGKEPAAEKPADGKEPAAEEQPQESIEERRVDPDENAEELATESLSEDAFVSLRAIDGLRTSNLYWGEKVQVALINAIGPKAEGDPEYLSKLPYRDDQMQRLFAVRAMTILMRPSKQASLIKSKAVRDLIKQANDDDDLQTDTIVNDELRRALMLRLNTILDHSQIQYSNYETRGWAADLLGRLRNSATDQTVEQDIIEDIIRPRFETEPSFHVRSWMMAVLAEPAFAAGSTAPEIFFAKNITAKGNLPREAAMAVKFLNKRPQHKDNRELRRTALVDATYIADPQIRSLALQGLAKLELDEDEEGKKTVVPDAVYDALFDRLFLDPSIYVRLLAASTIHRLPGGSDELESSLKNIKEALSGKGPNALNSPQLIKTIEAFIADHKKAQEKAAAAAAEAEAKKMSEQAHEPVDKDGHVPENKE